LWREFTDGNGDKFELDNAVPPFCNGNDYDLKPRTYEYGSN